MNDALSSIVPFLDLTSLGGNETEEAIEKLCIRAKSPYGNAAAICVYPQFARLARTFIGKENIQIATVANFPEGRSEINKALEETEYAIAEGANEVDLVIPYHEYLGGRPSRAAQLVESCKRACGNKVLLKVILETGELVSSDLIRAASKDAIAAGADFLKTSTGKVKIGATPEAAKIMLQAIKEALPRRIGFKAAGGVRTVESAMVYLELAEEIMGKGWATPDVFRVGTSGIV